jgi:SAM-dependent methyltransferase
METASALEKIQSCISPYKRFIYHSLNEFADELQLDSFQYIIDVGSGKSPYKNIFKCSGKYISIDCREESDADIVADVACLPIKMGIADVLLCIEVLEHVYPTNDAIKEMNRVLKVGGYLIITIPFIIGRHDYVDYFRFTEKALNRMLNDSGFSVVTVNRRGGIFTVLAGLLLSIPGQIFISTAPKSFFFALLLPLAILLPLLDRLDKVGGYTLGYEILAVKKQ